MDSEQYEKSMNAAIRFLSYRPRSKKEIVDFLKKKKAEVEIREKVIERLTEFGYIDDEKFAAWWIEQRSTFRPKGKKLLELELRAKGVNVETHVDEVELAKRAIEKKRHSWEKEKLYNFLFRRGFSSSVIDDILREGV